MSKYLDKIGIKFPCTAKTTLKDFLEFVKSGLFTSGAGKLELYDITNDYLNLFWL